MNENITLMCFSFGWDALLRLSCRICDAPDSYCCILLLVYQGAVGLSSLPLFSPFCLF